VPIAILVVALAGYFVVIPKTVADTQRLDSLVVQHSGIPSLVTKPSSSTSEDPSYGLPALAAAAKAQPTKTGSWSIDWTGRGKLGTNAEAYLVLDVLPTPAQAAALRTQLNGSYVGKATYDNLKFSYVAPVGLPAARAAGVPITGSTYRRLKSKTVSAATITTLTLQVGRADAIVYVQLPGASSAAGSKLAGSEMALLRRSEPSFTLATTTYPLGASLVWWAVALVLAALSWGGPKLVVAARDRRSARAEALARAQFAMRGQKVLKRRSGGQRTAAARRASRR
jgi:hypothetical protein